MMNLAEYRRKGTLLADYLPWAALVAPGVVLNKDGSLQRSARFRGPDLDSAVAAELVAVAGRSTTSFAASARAGRFSSKRSGWRRPTIPTAVFLIRPRRCSMPSAAQGSQSRGRISSRTIF